jgi:hypothetical protein
MSVGTLHRYFIWANQMRVHFDGIISKSKLGGAPEIESFLYMSYWYAALYVVIEGWRELELADATIDALLQSPNVDLLKLATAFSIFKRTTMTKGFCPS